jgi:hypothetical protein
LLLIVIFLCTGAMVKAQSSTGQDLFQRLQNEEDRGQIKIEADSLLVANYYKFLTANNKVSGVPGYRIRIYSESGLGAKDEQQRIRAKFLSLYPDTDAYYRYDEPYFKVYVGDCRTRSEALKLFDRVKKNFPNPILVEDYIKIQ